MNNQTEIIELDVTQEDIDKGIPRATRGCAIYKAAKRSKVEGLKFTTMEGALFCLPKDGGVFDRWVSPEAEEFAHAFDNGLPVTPTKLIFTKVD